MKDDDHPGCPRTSVATNNNEKLRDVIWKDHTLGVQAAAEMVHLDRESIWRILTDELNMKNICAKMGPKIAKWSKLWKKICSDLL